MAYYNGNAYRDPITEVLHDACMDKHTDRFVSLAEQCASVGCPNECRQQISPWNWSPAWSCADSPNPTLCADCGSPVVGVS